MATAPPEPDPAPRRRLRRSHRAGARPPEAVRRLSRGHLITVAVLVLATVAVIVLDVVGAFPSIGSAPIYAYVVLVLVACVFWHVAWKRTLRRAAAHDHLLCPDCTYDLRTLDATGTCPECGRPYEHTAVRAQWLDAERRLRGGKRVRSP